MANNIADDRRYVVEQWQYLFGRLPTIREIDEHTAWLRAAPSRTRVEWMKRMERRPTQGTRDAIVRIYRATLGRDPTPAQLERYYQQFVNGKQTRASAQWMGNPPKPRIRFY